MADKTYLKTTLTIVAISVLSQLTFAALPRYEVIDLGTLGGDWSEAYSVNESGEIVGFARDGSGGDHATLFDSSGNCNNIDLGTLGGNKSCANSINDGGQIVGRAARHALSSNATFFDTSGNGNNIDLGTLDGNWSFANSINNNGQIVGGATLSSGFWNATLFDPTGNGNNIDLLTLGGRSSRACSVNNRGQIVGNADNRSGFSRAAVFDASGNGNNIDLGTLGGDKSYAWSINDNGQIVGYAKNSSGYLHATLFDLSGSGNNIDLGSLGGNESWAFSINESGQIVGVAFDSSGYSRATLFDSSGNGNNVDLNLLINSGNGLALVCAYSINNSGWIVGKGIDPDGESRAFLMKPLPPTTYYVDDDVAGANDGSSWADAFNFLQDALAAAWSGDEIRVAQGTYKPDQGAAVTPSDRTATFQLINGVTLKGGYAGFGEPDPNARDTQIYETILTGDLNGDDPNNLNPEDLWGHPNRAENSYHVVTGGGTDSTAVLDGFTVTGGNANGNTLPHYGGGGMFNDNSRPIVKQCTFTDNSARYSGGGMFNYNYSSPTIKGCIFTANSAKDRAGGMYNAYKSSPTVESCTFIINSAKYGGGMNNSNFCSPTVKGCTFSANSATYGGGGMYNGYSSPTVEGCTFTNNSAADGSGMYNDNSSPAVNVCTFSTNSATDDGGGMFNNESDPALESCTFSGNSAQEGGGMYNKFPFYNRFRGPTVECCTFRSNSAQEGGGMYNYQSSPAVEGCTFRSNSARWGGGMYNSSSNPAVEGCTFSANSATGGGGMYNKYKSNPTVKGCTFSANLAKNGYGGGMCNFTGSPTVEGCTFNGNFAAIGGGMYSYSYSRPTVTNSILWADMPREISGDTPTVTFSDIQGGYSGTGNINADPCFVSPGYWDPNGIWIDGDYHLLEDSPCIDAGDPNYIAGPNETDLDGRPRVIGSRIDMGAYESPIFAEAWFVPRTINLTSMGNWITCYISLPEDYDVVDIDPNSVFLEEQIKAEQLSVNEQMHVAIAKFSRSDVQEILNIGEIELTVTGRLTDGIVFEATDIIKVIDKTGGKSAK
jgi:probable HAF family extracellular repeat protein